MKRQRLSASDRRISILEAARSLFAEKGFEGAGLQDIARRANISQALIFQHFQTKESLYRAVLRNLIAEQDEAYRSFGQLEAGGEGLVKTLAYYFSRCLRPFGPYSAHGARIQLASLAGEGSYAKLVAKRSARFSRAALAKAIDVARTQGVLNGPDQDINNIQLFVQNIGINLIVSRSRTPALLPYSDDDLTILHDTVWFCARGIGLDHKVIEAIDLGTFLNREN